MRKIIILTIVVLLLFNKESVYSQCCTPSTPNLVVNGSFELQDCTTEAVTPSFASNMSIHCSGVTWGATISIQQNGIYATATGSIQAGSWAGTPRTGSRYFVGDGLWGNGSSPDYNIAWSQNVSVVAGKLYQFKVYYYNEQTGNAPIAIGFNNDAPTVFSNTSIFRQWTELCTSYSATTTGTLTLKVYKYNMQSGSFANNDFGLDDIEFKETNLFELTPQSDVTICQGQSVGLSSVVSVGSGSYSYTWSSGQNTSSILVSPTSTTTYTVDVKDLVSGCVRRDEIQVNVIKLTLELGEGVRLCPAYPTTVTAYPAGGSGNYSYSWSTGATTQSISLTYTQTGTYNVSVADNVYGCTTSDNVVATQTECQGAKYYQNTESLPSLSYYNAIVAGRQVTTSIPVGDVKVKNGQNVTFKGGQYVSLEPGFSAEPGAIFLAYIQPECVFGEPTISKSNMSHCTYLLDANSIFGSGNYSYLWSTGATTKQISVSPGSTTIYSVTITDNCFGNSASTSYTLATRYLGDITTTVIPNLFTPNGDGVNDTWIVTDGGKQEYAFNAYSFNLQIYNRWGGRVWSLTGYKDPNSTGFKEGDIYWLGDGVSDDIYYAALDFTNCSNSHKTFTTWIHRLGASGSRIGQMDTSMVSEFYAKGMELNNIRVTPNPSQGKVKVEVPGTLSGTYILYIEDMYGKVVYEKRQESEFIEADLKGIAPGMYCVKVKRKDKTYSSKFILME